MDLGYRPKACVATIGRVARDLFERNPTVVKWSRRRIAAYSLVATLLAPENLHQPLRSLTEIAGFLKKRREEPDEKKHG